MMIINPSIDQKLTKKVQEAKEASDKNQTGTAIRLLEEVIKFECKNDQITEELITAKETATYKLANIYKEKGLIDELVNLQKAVLPLFIEFPKSKAAKISRTLFDLTKSIDANSMVGSDSVSFYGKLIDLSRHIISWCEQESRSFLRMRIETTLAELLFK
jgi:hypothetical protein